ncbi:MAG: cytochrome oxidase assembly protein [Candidatus Lambdaproteobacteria bacterium RIFOXYD1_FULL_56_27]|uniref:Cytochrome oxidase assembly protein n=1 Tax=Candidatus Lambdaproteobacteria bacterium RIFOXYD2_FULL_56_26 TaxID=1817773 RepID=A0A1F6H3H4_9PROT|nr:MAG: cytochrome oxidase assembly protein [Candidatus Lambdaproteobacteria bacterium RIFOXYC1_FULL_56_13]OGH04923.1 MAG: cytochrome oxidase assembly protein [Candidatus Lambdaproteobacteria bacterium RIFOXYD2_FULL_56_26]OGH09387.1 MAG: cytochrome oxidase assembly protein [Candidatus Lambdaproteobacteria bacterium RIFOXYD1_FULL_56_27]
MKLSGFAKYVWAVLVYNLGVILWGAYVRATGSGAGCGKHWPTCNGEVIPLEPSLKTLVEYSHRTTSGLALVTVLVMLVWAFKAFPKGHPARRGSALSVLFMITEGGLGAGLVLFELVAHDTSMARVWSMGLHLTNTFLLLSSLALTAWWASGGGDFSLKGQGAQGKKLYLGLLLVLVIGVTGAVTALGDTLFPPLEVGAGLVADGEGGVYFLKRLRVFHPILAVTLGLYLVFLGLSFRKPQFPPAIRTAGLLVIVSYVLQILVGVTNIFLKVPVSTQMIHLLCADLVWIFLVFLTAAVFSDRSTQG